MSLHVSSAATTTVAPDAAQNFLWGDPVSELQAALAALGLPRTGRKADLVLRLTAARSGVGGGGGGNGSDGPSLARQAAAPAAEADEDAPPAAAAARRRRAKGEAVAPAGSAAAEDREAAGGAGFGAAAAADAGTGAVSAAPAPRRVVRPRQSASTAGAAAGPVDTEATAATQPGRTRRLASPPPSPSPSAAEPPAPAAGTGRSPSPPPSSDASLRSRTRGAVAAAPPAADADASPSTGTAAALRRASGSTASPSPSASRSPSPSRRPSAAQSASGGDYDPARGPPPDLRDLPPWPAMFMGQPRRVTEMAPGDPDEQEVLLLSNPAGLTLTSLGSAAVRASATRGLGGLAMARGKDIFIFDAGDDTQRQVGRLQHVRPSKIFRIFLTSLAPESVLGLPGLMCTINSARERGHELSDIPVHVYGPPGTADFLASMMRVSQTYLEITIVVHEVCPRAVPESRSEPSLYASRARIWRVLMPPDQLNPRGGVDASLLLFAPSQGRAQKKKGRNASGGVLGFDPRAGYLPWPPLAAGDPDRTHLDPLSLSWTLELDISGRVVISQLPARGGGTTLVYTVLEADRSGALVMPRAVAAGLGEGQHLGDLKQGRAVNNRWGQTIPPELVISPLRPGRRVVVLGNTTDPSHLASQTHTHGADVLVAGGVWPKDEEAAAAEAGGCTAAALGDAARRLGVRYMLLSRFDSRRIEQLEAGGSDDGASGGGGGSGGGGAAQEYVRRIAAEVEAAATATTAGGRGKGAKAARPANGGQLRGVLVLDDLESVLVEKNEGPQER
ncbi:hypothetical protein GPECTOR_18g157 [Gonium pectorale]|uniref:SAP domain-containing protein n=1 Tax=Gonium pectorale TaxID=33097 RepID=A0A150GJM3_GONPE|nr:hypothetical protein GPECTOR_18g157 [Gonium pectorale]|eukprot:KXZ50002.1 hypothetical protein GPECTOR_18g157 [Gonium pectorale]